MVLCLLYRCQNHSKNMLIVDQYLTYPYTFYCKITFIYYIYFQGTICTVYLFTIGLNASFQKFIHVLVVLMPSQNE